ncbi:hypothetical protein SLEP1_g16433 [Rubroshorea leprosula]|uniref:Uncharacterized protein n=1 Tax=Rubroshorea leprosula TaxID=152421 RepID=A0AAV5IWH6_9ROSI|nr:hypothetical protein SLEP1_g16433 [Rubroshorea leprosula]
MGLHCAHFVALKTRFAKEATTLEYWAAHQQLLTYLLVFLMALELVIWVREGFLEEED